MNRLCALRSLRCIWRGHLESNQVLPLFRRTLNHRTSSDPRKRPPKGVGAYWWSAEGSNLPACTVPWLPTRLPTIQCCTPLIQCICKTMFVHLFSGGMPRDRTVECYLGNRFQGGLCTKHAAFHGLRPQHPFKGCPSCGWPPAFRYHGGSSRARSVAEYLGIEPSGFHLAPLSRRVTHHCVLYSKI